MTKGCKTANDLSFKATFFAILCNKMLLIRSSASHPAKIYLNKKWLPKQRTIQNFNIDVQGLGKRRNENSPTQEIGVTS